MTGVQTCALPIFPVCFPVTIGGVGEESDDSWHKYYHNGKMIKECRARIVFEEFDAEQYVRDNKLEELLK